MMSAGEIREWLSQFEDDAMVAVDEGGLTLVYVNDEDIYCEVGGTPEETEGE